MRTRRATATYPLHCPLPAALSPHADEVQRWLGGWLPRHLPGLDAVACRRIAQAGFARYAARLYPEAKPAVLRTVSAVFAWFFLLDDTADATSEPDTDRLGRLVGGASHVLRTGTPAPGPDPLHHLLADTWCDLRASMPADWCDRFVDAVHHHLDGVVAEARAKAAGHRPGVADYIELRRATSAAYVAHVLTEFAVGAPLPAAVVGHPAVRAYSTAGNDLLSWFNDLLSLDRDQVTAGGHNLVLALAAERGSTIEAAVREAAAMWQRRMDGLVRLRAAVPPLGDALDAALGCYLQGVERSVRGTLDWSLESVRYQPPAVVAPYLHGALDR